MQMRDLGLHSHFDLPIRGMKERVVQGIMIISIEIFCLGLFYDTFLFLFFISSFLNAYMQERDELNDCMDG